VVEDGRRSSATLLEDGSVVCQAVPAVVAGDEGRLVLMGIGT